MKKCFYKTFQKYSQNIMNRLNFEIAAFCFDDESETGFHWSARKSHHFFVQLGPSWLNDCLQGVQIGVVTSWNILLQNRPDSKVHGINKMAWGCPHLLVPKPSWFGPSPPHWRPKAQGPLCGLKHRRVKIYLFSKVSVSQGRIFSATCQNKFGCCYLLDADCARSSGIWFTRGCAYSWKCFLAL